jgi:hypothetical protein
MWTECLTSLERCVERESLDLQELTQGACVATYVGWLSTFAGEDSGHDRAAAALRRLVEAIGRVIATGHAEGPAAIRATAVVLASSGYSRSAAKLVASHDDISPDLALMIVPSDDARTIAQLRGVALDPGPEAFPPAFYFYCDALLRFGRITEVARLVREYRKDPADPMVADLLGNLYERGGQWGDARDVYKGSSWPIHGVRGALCAIVSNTSSADLADALAHLERRAVGQALALRDTEVDQLELARSSAFVSACQWNAVESWLIDFELGKLSFRRRRHWEADDHLSRAEASCPKSALFAIRSLRFSNLTWLSSRGRAARLPMRPEALEASFAAIEAADESDTDSDIRTWIAAETGDYSWLLAVLKGNDEWPLAQAHGLAGNTLEELTTLLSHVAFTYTPRALYRLIEWFSRARFYRSADYLTTLVLDESGHDFFTLWELGSTLLSLRSVVDRGSASHDRLQAGIRAVSGKLQELSQFDFQHLIRGFEFFAEQRRDDIAELLLTRASTLGDGTEENLAVAMARRASGRFGAGEGLDQGLACIVRAERAARHAVDRLLVAREYFHYGQVQKGRELLEHAGVFEEGRTRKDIEYVLALECGQWLEPVEFRSLARTAVTTSVRALRAGVRRRFDLLFLQRLFDTIAAVDKAFAQHLVREEGLRMIPSDAGAASANPQTGQRPTDEWAALLYDVQAPLQTVPTARAVAKTLRTVIGSRPAAGYVLWSKLLSRIEAVDDVVQRLKAAVEDPDRVPVAKNRRLTSARSTELHGLWQALAAASTDADRDRARERIRAFHDAERQLFHEWRRQQSQSAKPHLMKALECARAAAGVLEVVLEQRPYAKHASPILRTLNEHIESDIRDSLAYLRRRRRQLIQRLRSREAVLATTGSELHAG